MDYQEMRKAVLDAYHQRDYDRCFMLLDNFSEHAAGEELGQALILKSGLIVMVDATRATEGLYLVDEAIPLLAGNPFGLLGALVDGLALCGVMGDVERAKKYEVEAHRLLQRHGTDPKVKAGQFRLHLNLGRSAQFRGDYATAYWHFLQGTSALLASGTDDGSEPECWLFRFALHTAEVCLEMGRLPEAQEALDRAREWIAGPTDWLRWAITQAEYLRQGGRYKEATELLKEADSHRELRWTPETRARYHLARALLARDQGNLREFHRSLAPATHEAVEHRLDYLLAHIQRVQRSPLTLEV